MLLFVQFSIGLQAGKTGQKYDKINFNTGFCLLLNYENYFQIGTAKYLATTSVPCRKHSA